MATITTEEYDVAHRQAVAYLKGQVVGYAAYNGMKWASSKEPTTEFTKGFQEAQTYNWKGWVTTRHIIHNRLRHDRPHMVSVEAEDEFLTEFLYLLMGLVRSIEATLGEEAAEKAREVCNA